MKESVSRDISIEIYRPGDPLPEGLFEEMLDFVYVTLYEPFGHDKDGPWRDYASEGDSYRVFAFDSDGTMVGCTRFMRDLQIKTVATSPNRRKQGIGRVLMQAVEGIARERGATEIWLNARIPAVSFYEKLGFEASGEEFVNPPSNLMHRFMKKTLAP